MIDGRTLEEAAALVHRAAEKLDVTGTACAGCGHVHYGRWGEKQMKDELEAMERKLRKFASRTDDGAGPLNPTRRQRGEDEP